MIQSRNNDAPQYGRLRVKARRPDSHSDLPGCLQSTCFEKTSQHQRRLPARPRFPALYRALPRWLLAAAVSSICDPMHEAVENHRRQIRQAVFDRFSVGYLVSDRYESDPGWPVAVEGESHGSRWVIHRNPTVLPRAYVVPTAAIISEDESNPRARFLDVDPHEAVLMNDDPLVHVCDRPRQPFTPALWSHFAPDHPVYINVTTEGCGPTGCHRYLDARMDSPCGWRINSRSDRGNLAQKGPSRFEATGSPYN